VNGEEGTSEFTMMGMKGRKEKGGEEVKGES